MPQLGREIKHRIKSIGSTKKITKAMELVSASKMRKAVNNVLATRSYSNTAWDLVRRLAARSDSSWHPLLGNTLLEDGLEKQKSRVVGVLLISSNRGLCGNFNAQVSGAAMQYIAQLKAEGKTVEIITLGKKGAEIIARQKQNLVADFKKADITAKASEVKDVTDLLIQGFLNNKYSEIVLVYTDFISTLRQKVRVKKLLPLSLIEDDQLAVAGKLENKKQAADWEYLFEPAPEKVLAELLPRLLEMQIFQAVLESDASEHSARMMSMKNASDAASDMMADLTLIFNRARQASITAELADISGGKAALE